jgi:hypothetical protein
MSNSQDVMVIGSDAGGGTLVHRLVPPGALIPFERGAWPPREPQKWRATGPDGWAFHPEVHDWVGGAT